MDKIERRKKITQEEFQKSYLQANRPVIITDGMDTWKAKELWTADYFKNNYGNETVQLYDDLFNLQDLITLNEYMDNYFGQENKTKLVPYVRWYTRLKDYDFIWADAFFEKIKTYWHLPYFLPSNNYLLPYSFAQDLDPNKDMFPAKGLFISAKGARTRLHFDPWCSDAILCQVYGQKLITLYNPAEKKSLCTEDETVDIEKPDLNKFPNFKQATPSFIDTLNPGEIVFFPSNWLHHVTTVADSISLTWNFVHQSTWPAFFNYLTNNRKPEDLEVIKYFLDRGDKENQANLG